jgi:hypothetical protein
VRKRPSNASWRKKPAIFSIVLTGLRRRTSPSSAKRPKLRLGQKAQYVDELAVENSKLDAKMKTICRGC